MKTVVVTGAAGFIGKNLCAQLKQEPDIRLIKVDRSTTKSELKDIVKKSDFVFHLAGVNRPTDSSEFDSGNRAFTEHLIDAVTASGKKIPILFTSSIQADLDNEYGKSKRAAEELLLELKSKYQSPVFIYRLPNVFGKWCRPNYNSVVATFCHNIAHNLEIKISNPANMLTLVYIDDVVESFVWAMKGEIKASEKGYYSIPREFRISLGELSNKINAFNQSRKSLLVPNLENDFDRFLYATFITYLPEDKLSYKLDMKTDDRGWLAEFIKSSQFGQIFASKTKPGITRGNHWHHTKIEKFLVINGEADIKFRKIDTSEVMTYHVSGSLLEVVDIPAGYTHSITNTGDTDLLTLFWADELFNPDKPDTYYVEV